jgi:hypothetical protein
MEAGAGITLTMSVPLAYARLVVIS